MIKGKETRKGFTVKHLQNVLSLSYFLLIIAREEWTSEGGMNQQSPTLLDDYQASEIISYLESLMRLLNILTVKMVRPIRVYGVSFIAYGNKCETSILFVSLLGLTNLLYSCAHPTLQSFYSSLGSP